MPPVIISKEHVKKEIVGELELSQVEYAEMTS